MFFRPEVGDEVVVGFFNSDPRHAVVLGAMHNPKSVPPDAFAISADNLHKGIVTRGGSILGFSDDKPVVYIETPAGNKFSVDDDKKRLFLSDQHGNTITMSSEGIEIKSASDIKISASGKVEIAGSEVDVK